MVAIDSIREFVLLHINIAYILVALIVVFEGEIAAILSGIFSHLGAFNVYIALITITLGVIGKTFLFYNLGIYLQKKHSHRSFLNKVEQRVNKFFPYFEQKPFWSIFFSRFLLFGIYIFALIWAGYKKIDFKTYLKAEALSYVPWVIIMLGSGFFFSYTAISVSHNISHFFGIILLGFISYVILEKVIVTVAQTIRKNVIFKQEENINNS